jgi:hypothetical protein
VGKKNTGRWTEKQSELNAAEPDGSTPQAGAAQHEHHAHHGHLHDAVDAALRRDREERDAKA